MRLRLGSAISDSATHATADPSRWTHGVGVSCSVRGPITPTLPLVRASGTPSAQGEGSLPPAILALQPKSYWALLAET